MSFFKKNSEKNKESRKAAAKSAGFYSVLSLCLVAVGAAAWSATAGLGGISLGNNADSSGNAASYYSPSSVAETDNKLKNVPVDPDWESDKAAESAEADAKVKDVPDTTAHFFVMPVTGTILKKYNDTELQYSETYGDMRLHTGIDVQADLDTIIKSAGNGVVEKVYYDDLSGNTVIINHGNNIRGYYCGLNNIPKVGEGDVVLSGTELGSLSSTPFECADAPHFHFAMKKDDEWVSPLTLMNME